MGAHQVLALADEQARGLRHAYIGTEHELLGLVRERDGIGARVLVALGLPEGRIRADVIRIVGHGEQTSQAQQEHLPSPLPFTPRAQKVLSHANAEREALGHSETGTEHLLLGVLRGDGGVALEILRGVGIEPETARNEVIRALANEPLRHAGPGSRPVLPSEWLTPLAHVLGSLGTEIHDTLGRDPDTGDLLVVLACLSELPVARALEALGIDRTRLAAAVQQARRLQLVPPPDTDALDEIRRLLGLARPDAD